MQGGSFVIYKRRIMYIMYSLVLWWGGFIRVLVNYAPLRK